MKLVQLGNTLVVEVPAEVASDLGLKAGDDVIVRPAREAEDQAIQHETIDEAIAWMRRNARPLPAGYKFDREEANARGRL